MSALLDSLLDPARLAECQAHDAAERADAPGGGHYRPIPGCAAQAWIWPQVPWRSGERPARRRLDPPRPSRFADLATPTTTGGLAP